MRQHVTRSRSTFTAAAVLVAVLVGLALPQPARASDEPMPEQAPNEEAPPSPPWTVGIYVDQSAELLGKAGHSVWPLLSVHAGMHLESPGGVVARIGPTASIGFGLEAKETGSFYGHADILAVGAVVLGASQWFSSPQRGGLRHGIALAEGFVIKTGDASPWLGMDLQVLYTMHLWNDVVVGFGVRYQPAMMRHLARLSVPGLCLRVGWSGTPE